jgi:hypothetical protein
MVIPDAHAPRDQYIDAMVSGGGHDNAIGMLPVCAVVVTLAAAAVAAWNSTLHSTLHRRLG